ncbi:MAG: FAD-dependent oxidoreductase [Magnetospiraceae bacterium]
MVELTRGAYAKPGTSLAFKTGTWRVEKPVHQHFAAPCHGACPAGEDAQAWIAKIQEGKLRDAWETLVTANPLPAVTGRVCPHPCESNCNRGKYDAPIAIHNMERFLGDEALKNGWAYPIEAEPDADAPRVAVVGAGPAGLSMAYHLVRHGLNATLFDALPEAGGLLRSAIPMTRLPRDVLDAEIGRILDLGIDFRPRQMLGRDMSVEDLREDFDGVFLGVGCQASKSWDVDGVRPPDLRDGLEMLKEWIDHGTIPIPKRVAIHGGGNTAVDLARVMKRNGAEEVTIITASGLPGPETAPEDVLNVVPRELEEALEEGVVFQPFRTIKRLIMKGSRVKGVEVARLRKIKGKDGRKRRVAFAGTEQVVKVDVVIPAVGERVEVDGLEKVLGRDSYLWSDPWGHVTAATDLFAGGDARGDRGTVSAAIGDGRRAAKALAAELRGSEPAPEGRDPVGIDKLNLNYFEPGKKPTVPVLPVPDRTDASEIEGSLTRAQVTEEGNRCFSCGNCLACDNCWTLCPDNAVIKTVDLARDGSHYVFDYEFCKGCGLCATECPCGYIQMEVDED